MTSRHTGMSKRLAFIAKNKGILAIVAVFLFIVGKFLWDLISAERYDLAAVFLIATAVFVSAFVACIDTKHPSKEASYPMKLLKLWDMPLETTRTGLWMRAGFIILMGMALYFSVMYDSWIDDDGKIRLALMATEGMRVLFWLPLLYWVFRRQYNLVPSNQFEGSKPRLQKSDCPRKFSRREKLVSVSAIAVAIVSSLVIGMWLT